MSEDATVNAPTETRAAWTPEGEVKPPAPKVSEDAVIAAIATVYDPEIPVDIYQLGLVYAVEIENLGPSDAQGVTLDFVPTSTLPTPSSVTGAASSVRTIRTFRPFLNRSSM